MRWYEAPDMVDGWVEDCSAGWRISKAYQCHTLTVEACPGGFVARVFNYLNRPIFCQTVQTVQQGKRRALERAGWVLPKG